MLDAVIEFMPSPMDASDPRSARKRQRRDCRTPGLRYGAFAALAFKIATDPFVGNLTFSVSIPEYSSLGIRFTTR